MARFEIRIIGTAGQGSITAAIILAKAAVEDGKYATQTALYGAAMRTGVSIGDCIIDNEEIDFPKVINADAIIIQSQEAYDKIKLPSLTGNKDILANVKEGAYVILDKDLVKHNLDTSKYKVIEVPMAKVAAEVVGKRQVMNVVALAALQEITKMLSKEALEKAVVSSVPERFIELNKKALEEGYKMAKQALAL